MPGESYTVQEKIIEYADKGKGALMIVESTIKATGSGEVHATVKTSLFLVGRGGFGYKGKVPKTNFPAPPKRAPDHVGDETVPPNQAFLYRLNGDLNPLHVDPERSSMFGFPTPILHGLCSLGYTARSLQQRYLKNNPEALKELTVRFTSPVLPG